MVDIVFIISESGYKSKHLNGFFLNAKAAKKEIAIKKTKGSQ